MEDDATTTATSVYNMRQDCIKISNSMLGRVKEGKSNWTGGEGGVYGLGVGWGEQKWCTESPKTGLHFMTW